MDESFNGSFGLYCRGWNRLLIQVDYNDYSHVANETFVYMLTVQETTNKFADHLVYLVSIPAALYPLNLIERETKLNF